MFYCSQGDGQNIEGGCCWEGCSGQVGISWFRKGRSTTEQISVLKTKHCTVDI